MPKVDVRLEQIKCGTLPLVCVVCGAPASGRYFPSVGKWYSPWELVGQSPVFWQYTLLNGGRRGSPGGLPFCDRHRRYWPRRAWVMFGGVAVFLGLFLTGQALAARGFAETENGRHWLTRVGGLALLIHVPSCLVTHFGAMRPTRNSGTGLMLTGVAPAFADAVAASRAPAAPGTSSDGGA